jgi:hypothetical protein
LSQPPISGSWSSPIARDAHGREQEARHTAREHLCRGRHGVGLPGLVRRLRLRVGSAVEQHAHHLGAGGAVDRAVVDLGVEADAAIREPLDHVDLPERACAVERARVDARDQLGELLIVARGRHRDVSQVEVEIEVRVLDPERPVEIERHLDEAAPVRKELGEAAHERLLERVAERTPAEPRGIEDDQRSDVSELATGLHQQECVVEAGELLHGGPPGVPPPARAQQR